MSLPNSVVIIGIPAYLHDAMRTLTRDITETAGLLGALNAAHSDHIKAYGQLVDAVARYAADTEALSEKFTQAEAQLEELGATRT